MDRGQSSAPAKASAQIVAECPEAFDRALEIEGRSASRWFVGKWVTDPWWNLFA
jgi:hypothetical protein